MKAKIPELHPDLFEPVDTPVVEPKEESMIKKAKAEFRYDYSAGLTRSKCVHKKQKKHRFNFCELFGFRTSNEKSCSKFRKIEL